MTGNQIAYWKYAEDVRRNAETERQGRDSLAEAARHNAATERLTGRQIDLGYAQVGLGYSQLAETKRANTAREILGTSQLSETIRSNMAREAETNRSNVAKETEANRHNVQSETTDIHRMNIGHSEFQDQLAWDKEYKGKIDTPIRVGQGLVGLIGAGMKIGMATGG